MVGEQRSARRGHERREPLQQLQRFEEQRGGAVAPRASEVVEQLPIRALRQPRQRQRWAQEVAADLLQLIAAARGHGHVGVQAEAFEPGAARPRGGRGGGRAEATQWVPGARAEGQSRPV